MAIIPGTPATEDFLLLESGGQLILEEPAGRPPTPVARVTAADLCRRAMMSIGRLGANQPFDGDDLDICMSSLNDLIDAWKLNELLLECQQRAACGLRSGVYQYSIGPLYEDKRAVTAADFNVSYLPQIWWGSLILDCVGNPIERPLGPPRSLREFPTGVGVGAISNDFPDR